MMELSSSGNCGWLDSLRDSVSAVDSQRVREVLDSLGIGEPRKQTLKNNSDLIHHLIQSDNRRSSSTNHEKIKILYMLVDAGAEVNSLDNYNQTPLWLAMKFGNVAITQVLLQCGADTDEVYQNVSLWNWLMDNDSTEHAITRCSWCKNVEQLRQTFEKYGRGLGFAVLHGQIDLIRLGINFCCRTDVTVNGEKLINVAMNNGNDDITKLILRVTPYLNLAHHILAQDVAAVENWYNSESHSSLSSTSPLPLPLFHFGPFGNVPLVYFAIHYQNVKLVRLLLSKDHRVTARIHHEDVGDMPVVFSAFQPDMPLEVIRLVLDDLEKYDEKLHHLFWLDCNVLQVALRRRCSVQVTRLLLELGGPHLLCIRNSANETARDMAQSLQMFDHVDEIDQIVANWLTSDEYAHYRTLLALYSYDLGSIFENNGTVREHAETQAYKMEFYRLQDQLENLYNAIMDKDVETTRQLIRFEGPLIGSHHLPLECRLAGEGLPLLHIAVLNQLQDIVSLILDDVTTEHDINSLRDQFGRTALHYAYASRDSSQLIRLLINAGCSEAVFDMNGRRPDDYKEMRGSPEMERLLGCLRVQDYSSPLVDPLDPDLVCLHRQRQWERRVEAYRKNKSAFVGCRGTSLQNGSHFRHPVNDQPMWCTIL